MDIKINQGTSFKSGLTSQILLMEKNIKPKQVEKYFFNLTTKERWSFYNTDLKGNKAMATGNRLCIDIFNNLRKIFDYRAGHCTKDLLTPNDIYVFNRKDSEFYKDLYFFHLEHPEKIEPNGPTFQNGTIFMSNEVNSLEIINEARELLYKKNLTSSSHFMHTFVHEWLHAIFNKTLDDVCLKEEYNFNRTHEKYFSNKLTKKEQEIVSNVIGKYPITCKNAQYAETFADAWTKFICESLSEDCRTFKKNPLELMRATPKEFQKILRKVSIPKYVHYGEK